MYFLNFLLAVSLIHVATAVVKETVCNGKTYKYQSLAGYGFVPSDAYDVNHDTIGGIGSSIKIPRSSWKRSSTGFTGTLWAIPDRGWNTEGTLNYQSRAHKFHIELSPRPNATVHSPSGPNIDLTYLDTVFFTDPSETPTTGLDADDTGHLHRNGYPPLPVTDYTGNGFGGPGNGGRRVPVDSEGLVILDDGTFWISDEYGPYIYHFDTGGKMLEAIEPPSALIPRRNGSISFSADSSTVYSGEDDDVSPSDPDSGRENNHGLEGLTVSSDGKTLYSLLQAATVQEGGTSSSSEYYVRLLKYDISSAPAKYEAEYVVRLPQYQPADDDDDDSDLKTAAQSEIHYISDTQFLVLARDNNAGHGQDSSMSVYRHADVFDISEATNIKGSKYDCAKCSVAPDGQLKAGIKPAEYCKWLNYNVNSQLRRFGVHNGGDQDDKLLNEKWESLSLVPVNDGTDGEWFLFSMSDNDFITQNGYMNGGKYKYADSSGYNLDSQILAFQVSLPHGSQPS